MRLNQLLGKKMLKGLLLKSIKMPSFTPKEFMTRKKKKMLPTKNPNKVPKQNHKARPSIKEVLAQPKTDSDSQTSPRSIGAIEISSIPQYAFLFFQFLFQDQLEK